jgi:hypothetical protein
VSRDGAFEYEMGSDERISNEYAERVLSTRGNPTDDAAPSGELASFVVALRASVPQQPDPAVEASLIPRLAEIAAASSRSAAQDATTPMTPVARPSSWRPRLALLGAAVVLLPASMAGLAFAGVSLPDAVDEAFETAGIDLPNQAADGEGAAANAKGHGQAAGAPHSASEKSEPDSENANGEPGVPNKHGQGKAKGQGKGQAHEHHSQGHGPHSGVTPPGQGGTPPGQGGVPPGGGSDGSTGPPPSAGPPETPPGQGGVAPRQAKK